jgi:hypothetical protein
MIFQDILTHHWIDSASAILSLAISIILEFLVPTYSFQWGVILCDQTI